MLLSKEERGFFFKTLADNGVDFEELKRRLEDTQKIILICGPTCTGKSKLALNMANILNTDIISLDSMQIYKGMDIGTDKVNTGKYGIKQFMTDIFFPDHRVTVVEFRNMCRKIIKTEFFDKARIPVMAGGSGLYIRAVLDNLDFVSGKEDIDRKNTVRSSIVKEIEKKGIVKVFEELKKIDPVYADKISINDKKRIIRALEVFRTTGVPFSDFQKKWKTWESLYNCTRIGVFSDRDKTAGCIAKRIDIMFQKGLIDEVKKLAREGYDVYDSVKQGIGYKEVIEYINGKIDESELSEKIFKNTNKLVKKQLTWFRADQRINWIRTGNYDSILNLIISAFKIIWSDS